MSHLADRPWLPARSLELVRTVIAGMEGAAAAEIDARITALIARNRAIHDQQCFNLDPASNVMNPRAEAALASGLASRPSLGYPGDKYETGREAIEQIEIIAAELAARVFRARYAEVRVGSGALANLYGFMASARPGDAIIAPAASIGGHVTHHAAGCAGLYGLVVHSAPVDATGYTVDVEKLRYLALRVRPKVITLGGSLNLFPHPVREVRAIADEIGAILLFDAAHQCGVIAGGVWPNPLEEGAHLMTMSTYKSLGGPPGGLIVTNEAELACRIETIAFPGMTANFDAGRVAALAITLLDWVTCGRSYARTMVAVAQALVRELAKHGLNPFAAERGGTASHQFALEAAEFGGGQRASRRLRRAGYLACGIGLPLPPVEGDLNGLRMGTPELVRRGVAVRHAPELAARIAAALRSDDPDRLAPDTAAFRSRFGELHFIRR